MEKHVELHAPAKVNLALDVVGKRENGYHDVRMIMQTLNLYDTLTMERNKTGEIILKTNIPYLPVDENNLVYRAVSLIKEQYQIPDGITVDLKKKIPVAAGMAGGSSDCAAALKGMNRLFDLHLNENDLMGIGVSIGADVPYCIMEGTALSEGIGEILTPLPPMPQCPVLIVKPPFHVSTRYVYDHLNLESLRRHPDVDGMIKDLHSRNLNGISEKLGNVLENVTILKYPMIAEIKHSMLELGAMNALMSGSGPTVFGLFEEYDKAQKASRWFKQSDPTLKIFVTDFYNHL